VIGQRETTPKPDVHPSWSQSPTNVRCSTPRRSPTRSPPWLPGPRCRPGAPPRLHTAPRHSRPRLASSCQRVGRTARRDRSSLAKSVRPRTFGAHAWRLDLARDNPPPTIAQPAALTHYVEDPSTGRSLSSGSARPPTHRATARAIRSVGHHVSMNRLPRADRPSTHHPECRPRRTTTRRSLTFPSVPGQGTPSRRCWAGGLAVMRWIRR
jgi:hypothetical protein